MKTKGHILGQRTSVKRRELLAIEAADWVARGQLSAPADREEFSRWLMESPAHVKEFLAALAWSDTLSNDLNAWRADLDKLIPESNIIELTQGTALGPESPITRRRMTTRKLMTFGAAAATALLAVILVIQRVLLGDVYTTEVGEQRTVALPDGSLMSMNTQSNVRVTYSDDVRDIYLQSGQAMFSVAHDTNRPFRVHMDGTTVQAIGTRFDIRREPKEMKVAVIEGQVRVSLDTERSRPNSSSAPSVRVAAGQGVSVLQTGEVTPPAPINVNEAVAWQQRTLVFSDATLSEIIAEFERYTHTQIHIRDGQIGRLRFSGVWDADRPDLLLAYLRRQGGVQVEQSGDQFVLHSSTITPSAE